MASNPTSNFDFQNFYSTTLSADLTAGGLTISLSTVPTPSEGILILDPDSTTNREIIYYTSKGASTVTCPSDGRGWDGTTGVAHLTGTTVIMAPVAYMLRMLKTGSLFDSSSTGWTTLGLTPGVTSYNGNRSYTLSTASDKSTVLTPGMRLKMDRSVAAPTQCTSLNGTTQYYSKTSPAGMTFTNNFVVSAWIKLSSYAASSMMVVSRYNGTSGWALYLNSSGRIGMDGYNAGAANVSSVLSYQSVPLNKWVHIAVQLDMATFTATPTTSYIMIDGVDVPASVSRGGTNPTALVQAGNLEVGSWNGGTLPFPGKIAQVAIYSAKVTQATILASISQGLAGTETSLISAYSFNNSINDLNANANNLTANGSAVATNADSPFAQAATAGLTEYAIITKVTTSTLTVQVPEGSAIPTSGGLANCFYSTQKVPYLFPAQRGKWTIKMLGKQIYTQSSPVSNTWYNLTTTTAVSGGLVLNVPIGEWSVKYSVSGFVQNATNPSSYFTTLSTANNTESDTEWTSRGVYIAASAIGGASSVFRSGALSLSAAASYYLNIKTDTASAVTLSIGPANEATIIEAELAYL